MGLIIKQNELEQRWLIKWTQKPQRKEKGCKTCEGGQVCQWQCEGLQAPHKSALTKGEGGQCFCSVKPAGNKIHWAEKPAWDAPTRQSISKQNFLQALPVVCDEQLTNVSS